MNELQLLSHQQPGQVSIDNFQYLHDALVAALARYEDIVYTKEMLPSAKAEKRNLSRLRREIEDRRKEIKRAYLVPYNEFESQVKELIALIDAPLDKIKDFISTEENEQKQAKRSEIESYFFQCSAPLDVMAKQVWDSPAFFDPKWLNKSTSAKVWQQAVREKIAMAARDLQNIQVTSGTHTGAVTARYLETLSTEGLSEYRARLSAASQTETAKIETNIQDHRIGSKTLKLSGPVDVLAQAMEMLVLLGLDCDILEDDTPQPMPELTVPDFDSFVAFDLETSGTRGAASGDAPAEITEIGAVRVEHGKIVERFSTLVNPGRKILPFISRITGITDDMVVGKPDVETAIRLFAKFAGNSILVGHNIKASDLHYIDRAARRAGIRLENAFFDTYYYARKWKKKMAWTKITLTYLAEQFAVKQPDAHRAWCDAETSAMVYMQLKSIESKEWTR